MTKETKPEQVERSAYEQTINAVELDLNTGLSGSKVHPLYSLPFVPRISDHTAILM